MNLALHIAIPAMWMAWLAYWAYAAGAVKETRRSEGVRSRLTYHGPLILGGVLIAVPNILGSQLERLYAARTPFWLALPIVLVALGLGFATAARVRIGRNWSSNVTVKQDHELIRSGPYALVRHPIYTGLLLALVGTALMVGNGRALIGLAIMVGAIVRKLKIEERYMTEQFGDAYARYRAQVAMLVPFVM